jgi:membrane-associated protein
VFSSIANAVSGSPWTYVLLLAIVAGDAVFPVLPSETVIIAAAVLAAQGHLNIALVIIAAFVGALLGDNAAYGIGHSGLRRVADRLLRSEKNRHRLEWGRSQLEHHGVWIIIVARFIPGGRTATTYVAGTVGMPWKRRFLPADAIAAALWSLYASALGYIGGASFENNLWLPMLIGAAASLLVGGIGELVRRKVLDRGTKERGSGGAPQPTGAASAKERQAPRSARPRAPAANAAAETDEAKTTRARSSG